MEQKLNIDDVLEDALDQDCFKDDVLRRTEEQLKADLNKTMAEFKNDLDLFFAIKDAIAKLPDIEVRPAKEEKPLKKSIGLPGICCGYMAKQDGFECHGTIRLAYPESRNREFFINGVILSDDARQYGTCMSEVIIYKGRTINEVPQIINEFRTALLRVFFDHDIRNRNDR